MHSARVRRPVAASIPVLAVLYAWSTLEIGPSRGLFVPVALAAVGASLPTRPAARLAVAALVWGALAAVLVRASSASVAEIVDRGVSDAYAIAPPFVAATHTELAALVVLLAALFALGSAVVALDRPFVAVIVVAAGVGVPTTINPSRNTIVMGALALVAVLWPLATAAMPERSAFGPGLAAIAAITVAAVVLAGIGARPSVAALDWRSWDLFGESHAGTTIALVWSSNDTGIDLPPGKTSVLRVKAPRRGL